MNMKLIALIFGALLFGTDALEKQQALLTRRGGIGQRAGCFPPPCMVQTKIKFTKYKQQKHKKQGGGITKSETPKLFGGKGGKTYP